MVVEENEQVLAIGLGAAGLSVILCAAICCCRDAARRSRLKDQAYDPQPLPTRASEKSGLAASPRDEEDLQQILVTGYVAPIRRLDPYAFKKTARKGNNVQKDYNQVLSSTEEVWIDGAVRAYGSLAAEVDPEDRLKLIPRTPRSARSTGSKDSKEQLKKGARNLSGQTGSAPTREESVAASKAKAKPKAIGATRKQAQDALAATPAAASSSSAPAPKVEDTSQSSPSLPEKVQPQLLGKQQTGTTSIREQLGLAPLVRLEDHLDARDFECDDGAQALLGQIELPPPPPPKIPTPAAADVMARREREAKFDAMDADLTEELGRP